MTGPLVGVMLHAVGAGSAALCYTPQKKTRGWSWQTYWLAQAFVCWLLLPVVAAAITTPHLWLVLRESSMDVLMKTTALGFCYGIGGTAFGVAIQYLGLSMTYALSVGTSCVLGTILPPLFAGQLHTILHRQGASWILLGIAVAATGIFASGVAGRMRDADHDQGPRSQTRSSNLTRGLSLALLAGILSALFGLSLATGQPIADAAARHGAGRYQGNVILIFSCGGAFLSTLLLCLYLHWRDASFHEFIEFADGPERRLMAANLSLAALTGLLWYAQFFFYSVAHTFMGFYRFTSWAIHMAMLVLFSIGVGAALKEWHRCRRTTVLVLALALVLLLLAVFVIGYGNYLGGT